MIIGFLLTGLCGYFLGSLQGKAATQKSITAPALSPTTSTNTPITHSSTMEASNDIKYWIDGVPRKETETIFYNGKYYAPVTYMAEAFGEGNNYLDDQKYISEQKLIHFGLSMEERVANEKLIANQSTILKLLQNETDVS